MVIWSAVLPVVSCSYRPAVRHDQTWIYLLWTFKYGLKERQSCEIHIMVLPTYHHDLSRADFFILSLLVMMMSILKRPNQPLERNVYVRHASCGARFTPAIAVAHL